jgi:hypothetical protein
MELFPQLSTLQLIAAPLLMVWIAIETAWDFKNQNIPIGFSLIPLLGGVAVLAVNGEWLTAIVITVFVFVTNFSAKIAIPTILGGSIIVFSNIPAQYFPLFVGFLLMYTFFQAGIMGGADSLAAIYMLLWFPSWGMLGTLLWGMLIIASVILYKKYKKQSLIKIIQTVKSGDEDTKSPTMIGFSFGSASYFAIILIFSLLGPIS